MRSKVFFIGMDKAIEDEINNYIACQSTDQLTRPSKNLIKVFHVIFGQYGYPREIISDNGPPFQSEEIRTISVNTPSFITESHLIGRKQTEKLSTL